MKWMEIAVRVRREDIDAASDVFDGIKTGGVVIEDPALIYAVISQGNAETLAMDAPADPFAPPVVKGYLPVDGNLSGRLAELYDGLGRIDPAYREQVVLAEKDDSSWLDRWRQFYRPERVGRRLLVKPVWEPVEPAEGLLVIELDPGMAFGCGTHPTTRMCMTLIEDVVGGGETVLDVGTGSGILSIAAAKMGAAAVVAVDSDGVAVRVARENVAVNGLTGVVDVREGNLLDGVDTPADVIVANIVADVIMEMLPRAVSLLKEGGKFIASGVIAGRRGEVAGAVEKSGLNILKTLAEGEWAAFLAEKPAAKNLLRHSI
ncbi:MAG: 50S ribosomal protein L11 methyltransferase [Peptococcaceae bacterium]|nr:50S ribosomal protein L11 methyltransferase [Peptococcaceae bacterium]